MNDIETLKADIKMLEVKINKEAAARMLSISIAKGDRQILKQKQRQLELLTGLAATTSTGHDTGIDVINF